MRALLSSSKISGATEAPSSKSYTLRSIMCAALARGESEIIRPLDADDTAAARDVLTRIGVGIEDRGSSWLVTGDSFRTPGADLCCRDSAGTLRFMMAICTLVPGICRLTAGTSLANRPVGPLAGALRQLGVDCDTRDEKPPVSVHGGTLRGGTVQLPGDVSSQFVSALLFIAALAPGGLTVALTSRPESRPYILMTLDCLKDFGIDAEYNDELTLLHIRPQIYRPARYAVEGDWSSASCLLALGAVGGRTDVSNLNPGSRQADTAILGLLNNLGAQVQTGDNVVRVQRSSLGAFQADLSDCIDLLPAAAALAASADGTSEITGISRARLKESDRVAAMKEGLEKMGIRVDEQPGVLRITGGAPHGAVIDSKKDHRIAMAFSVLGILAGNTVVEDAECVTKTFPAFWDTLASLGGKVKLDEQ